MEFGTQQKINAKIKFSFLGVEDGNLLFQLGFEAQGGYTLVTDKRPVNIELIANLLNTLEVRSWEELSRKFARIQVDGKKVIAVGNVIEDRWVRL